MARRPEIDGRDLLIAAALRLFSEHGIDGVSIRAVNREAGLGPATAHYHFGTKEALVDAVLDMFAGQIVSAVSARAKALTAGDGITARDLVLAMTEPYLELMAAEPVNGRRWIKVISQVGHSGTTRHQLIGPAKAATRAAARAFPTSTPVKRETALQLCQSLLLLRLADEDVHARGHSRWRDDVELLVDFLSGGVQTALSQTTGSSTRSA